MIGAAAAALRANGAQISAAAPSRCELGLRTPQHSVSAVPRMLCKRHVLPGILSARLGLLKLGMGFAPYLGSMCV
jgi:hypothetical protein